VAFHRALVDAAGNPVLSYQLAGAVEAMQPLMNMITFTARSREAIVALHARIADAAEARDAARVSAALEELEAYTVTLARSVLAERAAHRNARKGRGRHEPRAKRLRAGNIECTCGDWGPNLVYAASDQMPPTGIPTTMTRHFVLGTAISAVLAIPAFAQDLLVFDYSGFEDPVLHQPFIDTHGGSPEFVFFGDEDEAFQRLLAGFRSDVTHICAGSVPRWEASGIIEPWDRAHRCL
jgi:hypothetical protein